MKNNRTLIHYIQEYIDCKTIKENTKLLIYVSQNNNYDSIDIDEWVNLEKEPLTDDEVERMKMAFWLLEHQENIQEYLAERN